MDTDKMESATKAESEMNEGIQLHDVNPNINKHANQGDQISDVDADLENKFVPDTVYQVQEPVSHEMPSSIPDTRKKGASGMAGFMFWTNGIGVFLLLIGFVTPGWLILDNEEHQDFGLWYMTQCSFQDVRTTCQTLSYHTIEAMFGNRFYNYPCGEHDYEYDCELRIGGLKFSGLDLYSLLYFDNTPLPFTSSDIARYQALYTVGLILAILTLKVWYRFRKRVRKNRTVGFSKTKWIFMLFVSVLSVLFVLLAVIGFAVLESEIGSYTKSPVGRVFAGFGAGMMLLCIIVIFMHLLFCRNSIDTYICSLTFRRKTPQNRGRV